METAWSGKWVAFGAYQVVQGSIRPAKGAEPHYYDPWEGFEAVRTGRAGVGRSATGGTLRPYGALFQVVHAHETAPAPVAERAALSWCVRFGLLGLGSWSGWVRTIHQGWSVDLQTRSGPFHDRVPHERIDDFWRASTQLRDAVRALAAEASTSRAMNELQRWAIGRWGVAVATDGTRRLVWDAPSLLSTYAAMVLRDYAAWGPPRECTQCGSPFLTAAHQAKYCSLACRWRTQNAARMSTRDPRSEP